MEHEIFTFSDSILDCVVESVCYNILVLVPWRPLHLNE